MKPYEQAITSTSASVNTLEQLEQVRMSPGERRMARAYLRQSELFADMLMRAHAELRAAFGYAGRGIAALVRRGKVSAARAELG